MAVLELAVAVTAGCNCTISIDARHLLLCHSDLQSGSESIEGLGGCAASAGSEIWKADFILE
jgi:hypothetical protein